MVSFDGSPVVGLLPVPDGAPPGPPPGGQLKCTLVQDTVSVYICFALLARFWNWSLGCMIKIPGTVDSDPLSVS